MKKIGIGSGSCGLGYGAGSLWIEDTSSSTISRVSARTGKRTAAVDVGIQPYDATFAFGSAWATAYSGGDVERIDPARNKVVKRYPLPSATGVVGAFCSIWATGQDGVIRIDPATDQVVANDPDRRRRRLDRGFRQRGLGDDHHRHRADRPDDEPGRRDDRARHAGTR